MSTLDVPISLDLADALKQMDKLAAKAKDVGVKSGAEIGKGVAAGAGKGVASAGGGIGSAISGMTGISSATIGAGITGVIVDQVANKLRMSIGAVETMNRPGVNPAKGWEAMKAALPFGESVGGLAEYGVFGRSVSDMQAELERKKDLNAIRTQIRFSRLSAAGDTMGAQEALISEKYKNAMADAAGDEQKRALLRTAKNYELTALAASGGNASTLGAGSFGQMTMANVEMLQAMQAVAKNTGDPMPATLR
jgi:hypothetical protein